MKSEEGLGARGAVCGAESICKGPVVIKGLVRLGKRKWCTLERENGLPWRGAGEGPSPEMTGSTRQRKHAIFILRPPWLPQQSRWEGYTSTYDKQSPLRPHLHHMGMKSAPLLDSVQKFLEGPEGCALTPDAQAAHVDHVPGLRGT